MESKFHLLPVGQHFQWEGKSYVKTTPLVATQVPEGGQKFMPRAALVKVAGAESIPPPSVATPATLDSATVRTAIDRYHQRCMQINDSYPQREGDIIAQVKSELENIYQDLLGELKLKAD